MINFRQNLKQILVHLLDKTGPFRGNKNNGVEKWYTSVKNISKAYSLLFLLYRNPRNSRIINRMAAEEIWQSRPLFQKYELEKFKKYDKNMKVLTSKRKQLIKEEEEAYQREMLRLPRNESTSRNYPFWNTHSA